MAVERLYIENTYIPLSEGLNPSITKSITDVDEPDKRKSTFSKTVAIPRSKEADKLFEQIFEVNITNRTFNIQQKADVVYTVDDVIILRGFLKLNEIRVTDFNDIVYDVTMSSDTANFFEEIKTAYLRDLYTSSGNYEGLDVYNHTFNEEIQAYSWDTQVIYNSPTFIPFAFGTGYVYPLIDYGLTTDATNFFVDQIGCCIYVREYLTKMIDWAGFGYSSSWIDSSLCKHLIIPSSPETYTLTSSDIADMQFVANTPTFTSSGTTTTANLTKNNFGASDLIKFTNDSVAPGTDPGLNYDPATGIFTVVTNGIYDLNLLCDLRVEFTPSTGASVKTRSEVWGNLIMTYEPFGGSETQINSVPFWITSEDTSYTSGTRTTTNNPTYEDKDYLNYKHWAKSTPDSSLTGRAYAIPNRYQLNVNSMQLYSGDKVRVYHASGLFGYGFEGNPFTTKYFVDSGGTYYDGNAKLLCSVGVFYNKVVNNLVAYNNTLTMDKVIPDKVKMIDFFTSICKMFNLWVDIDPNNPKTLIIEQREDYLGSDVLKIHELIDRSKPMTHIPMGALDVKRFNYKYKDDTDYYNSLYKTSWLNTYGNREVDVLTDWHTQEKTTEVIFSPTPVVGLPNQDRVLPTIYQLDDSNFPKPTKHNLRILYYDGMKSCSTTWNHLHHVQGSIWMGAPLVDTYSEYPYAGHWDDPFNPTLDINFGLVEEVYYDNNLQDINATNNNLVNAYHSDYIGAVTDKNSRILKAYVNLSPAMYFAFTFDKLYEFDNAYFRLQKIENYNPTSEETTLCEFLQLTSIDAFVSNTFPVDGAPSGIDTDWGGTGADMTEKVPTKGTKSALQDNGNNYTDKDAVVKGSNNMINPGTKKVMIQGDYNMVESYTENINIQGDSNIIKSGVKNVTLINTSSVTVDDSDVTYINGKIQGYWETKTADFTVDETVEGYYIDSTAGAIDVTVPTGSQYSYWKFKRTDSSLNNVTLSNAVDEIDEGRKYTLVPLESITIIWNNDNQTYNII